MSRPGTPIQQLVAQAFSQSSELAGNYKAKDKILDAALELLVEQGAAATSMVQIAERAKIGRATLFRRFGSKDDLIQAVVGRELSHFLTWMLERFVDVTEPVERISLAFLACVRLMQHPMLAKLSSLEQAEAITILSAGEPSPVETARRFIAAHIADGQKAGQIPSQSDPGVLAEALIRLTLGYLQTPSQLVDFSNDEAVLDFGRKVVANLVMAPH